MSTEGNDTFNQQESDHGGDVTVTVRVVPAPAAMVEQQRQPSRHACRACYEDCPLALYFPLRRMKDFINTKNLYGEAKVKKMLQAVEPSKRAIAAETMIFEANAGANDPAGGYLRMAQDLWKHIERCQVEMSLVNVLLAPYRAQATQILSDQCNNPIMVDQGAAALEDPVEGYNRISQSLGNHIALRNTELASLNDRMQNVYQEAFSNIPTMPAGGAAVDDPFPYLAPHAYINLSTMPSGGYFQFPLSDFHSGVSSKDLEKERVDFKKENQYTTMSQL